MSRLPNFSRQASADLDEAVGWVLDHGGSGQAAGRMLRDVQIAGERLAERPHLARRRPDLLPDPFRFWSLPRHRLLLVCNPAETPARVVRILNTSRDLVSLLADLAQSDEP